jgi:GTP-binding protein
MRFVDEVSIQVESGAGGDGACSFRREKYVAYGGPDGGDGGRGGDVVLEATRRKSTLLDLRGHSLWRAPAGGRGQQRNMTGANGPDLVVQVPVGTRVVDEDTGKLLGDLRRDGQRLRVARGGGAGRGNNAFKSATNRTPRETTPGGDGESRRLHLELSVMADVGLLGYPNAGKSTLISRMSAARPRIADYPFTTLVPHLGVVRVGYENYVVADIPGLIEGAADGAGLGHRFLRHLSRTRALLHLVSVSPDEDEPPATRYANIRRELRRYDPRLLSRPEIVVLTKTDTVPPEVLPRLRADLEEAAAGAQAMLLAAPGTGEGVQAVIYAAWNLLQALPGGEE